MTAAAISSPRAAPADDPTDQATPADRSGGPGATPDGALAERVGTLLGIAIVVIYAAATLDRWSLWHDEAYTLAAVNDPWLSLTSTHGTMGLYYVLMWAWGQVSVAAWWLRMPSVLMAIGSLLVTRSIARRIGGPRLAGYAVPLLALIPVFGHKATEARSYGLETLLVCASWWVALRAADESEDGHDRRWALALAGLSVAGVFSHGLFLIHLAPLALIALLGRRPVAALLRLAPALVAAAAIAWALRSAGASNVGVTFHGSTADWLRITTGEYLAGPGPIRLLVAAAWATGTWLSLRAALRASSAAERVRAAVPVAWTVVPCLALVLISTAYPLNHPRYLSPITPGIALTFAVVALHVDTAVRASGRAGVRRGTPLLAGVGISALLAVSLVTTPNPNGQDWRAAARLVATEARDGDAILFANVSNGEPEQHRPPFEAAWAEVDPTTTPAVVSSSRPLGSVRRYEPDPRPASAMAEAAQGHDRVWIVDGGTGASVGSASILADPGFAGLDLVEEWERTDGIAVALYAWSGA